MSKVIMIKWPSYRRLEISKHEQSLKIYIRMLSNYEYIYIYIYIKRTSRLHGLHSFNFPFSNFHQFTVRQFYSLPGIN